MSAAILHLTTGVVYARAILGSITVGSSITPATNDGAALGSTSLQFSDLFLAEGGVINWDNGDATLTQVGNNVTLAGANFNALQVNTPFVGNESATALGLFTSNITRWNVLSTGHFTANVDNTYDIGASGATRPRTIYVGTSVVAPAINATGILTGLSATGTTAGGLQAIGVGTTAALGIYFGSGVPTVSAAQGSIYIRSDGSSTSTRLYINTDAGTTWTNVTTAA